METKLLLLKLITLIYYRSYVKEHVSYTDGLIERALDFVLVPDTITPGDRENNVILKLRSLVVWLSKLHDSNNLPHDDIMTRIRIATGDNDRIYDLFQRHLLPVDDQEPAINRSKDLIRDITQFIAIEDLVALMRTASRKIAFDREGIEDVSRWKAELITKLEALPVEGVRRVSSTSRCIRIENMDELEEIFEIAEKAIDPRGMLKFHHKAMNRMTAQGEYEGARRGDYMNVTAAPNNNKSGTLIDIFLAMCLYNSPCCFKEGARPIHLFITIEDPLESVIQKVYRILKQLETDLPVKTEGITYREMAEVINTRLRINGFEVRMMQFPRGGHVDAFIADIQDIIDEGYEIHSIGCDYPYLIGKEGIPAVVAGDEVPNLIAHIRAFTNPKMIFFYGAHQLSTEGRALSRLYPIEYIKQLSGKGFFEGSKKTDNPFDISIYVDKAVVNDVVYMQYQWDKRRGLGATPEKDKYYAIKFNPYPMIGVPYDADKDYDLSFAKIGARLANGDAGTEWDDF